MDVAHPVQVADHYSPIWSTDSAGVAMRIILRDLREKHVIIV